MANKLPEFLRLKFIEWQAISCNNTTLKGFAKYLGVSAQILSMWMNGSRKPGPKKIILLAAKLGPEIYDALGIPRPDPDLQILSSLWPHLPKEMRRTFREQAERYMAQSQMDQ